MRRRRWGERCGILVGELTTMNDFLKSVQVIALGIWVGSIVFFSFIVAPGAFATLKNRDQAGALVGYSLSRLHLFGLILAVLYLVAGFVLVRSMKDLTQPAIICVALMLVLTVVSQTKVTSRMSALRTQMVSVDATPADNVLRVEFDQLHGISVKLEVAVLLLGLASLFLTVRAPVD